MRHLSADDSGDLRSLGLHRQRLKVVSRADEVELGRQLVSRAVLRVEPVAGEDGQLAVVGEIRQTLLERDEVAVHGGACSLSKVVSVRRIGLEGVQRVHVVEGSQVVEPQDMAVQELRAFQQVADDARVVRDLDAVGFFGRDSGRVGVGHRAHAADALHDLGSILGRAVLDDHLHAAEAAAGHPGIGNLAVGHFHLDAEMAFDTGNRVDD